MEDETIKDENEEWDHYRIPAREFYTEERDKTKENWFLYELSNMLYDALIDEETISKEYTEQELVELSLKLSRCGRELVQGLSGSRKGRNVYVTTKKIGLKLESLQLIHKRAFVRVLTEAINSLVDICLCCPTQCIHDWKGKCYMFDMGPY